MRTQTSPRPLMEVKKLWYCLLSCPSKAGISVSGRIDDSRWREEWLAGSLKVHVILVFNVYLYGDAKMVSKAMVHQIIQS